jgi:hypothetical protein
MNGASNLRLGDRVRYVPLHAHDNIHHEDCEEGIVTAFSATAHLVFVRFGGQVFSKACDIDTLVKQP